MKMVSPGHCVQDRIEVDAVEASFSELSASVALHPVINFVGYAVGKAKFRKSIERGVGTICLSVFSLKLRPGAYLGYLASISEGSEYQLSIVTKL